jgi:hypothetical protein
MDEELSIFLGKTLLGIFLLVGVFMGIIYFGEKFITCPKFGKNVGLEYKYDWLAGGCFINYQGQWIPSDNLRAGKLD